MKAKKRREIAKQIVDFGRRVFLEKLAMDFKTPMVTSYISEGEYEARIARVERAIVEATKKIAKNPKRRVSVKVPVGP